MAVCARAKDKGRKTKGGQYSAQSSLQKMPIVNQFITNNKWT